MCVCKHKAYKKYLVEKECLAEILDKELDILDIITWYYISIPTYIYIAILIVKEYKCRARYRLIKICKYIYLYYSKCKYKFH